MFRGTTSSEGVSTPLTYQHGRTASTNVTAVPISTTSSGGPVGGTPIAEGLHAGSVSQLAQRTHIRGATSGGSSGGDHHLYLGMGSQTALQHQQQLQQQFASHNNNDYAHMIQQHHRRMASNTTLTNSFDSSGGEDMAPRRGDGTFIHIPTIASGGGSTRGESPASRGGVGGNYGGDDASPTVCSPTTDRVGFAAQSSVTPSMPQNQRPSANATTSSTYFPWPSFCCCGSMTSSSNTSSKFVISPKAIIKATLSPKGVVLIVLVAQSCASLLLTRFTRSRVPKDPSDPPLFAVPSAVICTEAIKLIVCFWWVFLTEFRKVRPGGFASPGGNNNNAASAAGLSVGSGSSQLLLGGGGGAVVVDSTISNGGAIVTNNGAASTVAVAGGGNPFASPTQSVFGVSMYSVSSITNIAAHLTGGAAGENTANTTAGSAGSPSPIPATRSGLLKGQQGASSSFAPSSSSSRQCLAAFKSPKAYLKQCAYVFEVTFRRQGATRMMLPAMLFTFQSNIIYVALQNVEVTLFQVLYQSKLLLTALFVGYAFQRSFSSLQWASLFALFVGVVISQLGAASGNNNNSSAGTSAAPAATTAVVPTTMAKLLAAATEDASSLGANVSGQFIGIAALLASSVSSAVAAVVMEKIIKDQSGGGGNSNAAAGGNGKDSKDSNNGPVTNNTTEGTQQQAQPQTAPASLAVRNVQLAVFSLTLASMVSAVQTMHSVANEATTAANGMLQAPTHTYPDPWLSDYVGNFFLGFDAFVWVLVLTQAVGGIIVALVLKYADNILKGFATAICIFICGAYSCVMWGTQLTPSFLVGATIVTVAVMTYSLAS